MLMHVYVLCVCIVYHGHDGDNTTKYFVCFQKNICNYSLNDSWIYITFSSVYP